MKGQSYVKDDIIRQIYDFYNQHGRIVVRDLKSANNLPTITAITYFWGSFQNCLRDLGIFQDSYCFNKKQGLTEGNKTNIVVGKRGKKFPLVYLDDTRDLIAKYLEQRGDDDIESLWVKIVGDTKTEITKDCLYNRMVSISNIFSQVRGEPCNIFCHTMRHSRAECLKQGTDTRLVDENGKPRAFTIDRIAIFMHHSDISTTQLYLMNHDEEEIDEMFGI